MNRRIFVLILLLSCVVITIVSIRVLEKSSFKRQEGNEEEKEEEEKEKAFVPYEGYVWLEHDAFTSGYERSSPNALNGVYEDSIASFRINKVKKYSQLRIFPENYHPLKSYHKKIYGRITPGEDWVSSVVYYIANPYLLVIFSNARCVNPINLLCSYFDLFYEDGVIKEIHKGDDAIKWFNNVFDESLDYPGKIWAVMVNAVDAGFPYGYIDINKSKNVRKSLDPSNITNKVHNPRYIYHVGKYNRNNLSPNDPDAWVTLKEKNVDTEVYLKLWKKKPDSSSQKPDIVYILKIEMETDLY
jgi:hypothetical protein